MSKKFNAIIVSPYAEGGRQEINVPNVKLSVERLNGTNHRLDLLSGKYIVIENMKYVGYVPRAEADARFSSLVARYKLTEESPMSKKAKKKVSKTTPRSTRRGKTGKKRAKKVRVKSTSTVTKKRVKRAKKVRVKSSSTVSHKKSKKKASKTTPRSTRRGKTARRKYANKKGKAWQAFMAQEEKFARPMTGPMTPAQAKANARLAKRLAKAKAAFAKAEKLAFDAKPEKAKAKSKKKTARRKYANKKGKAWQAFMAKESKARRPMQGPVQRKKRVSKPKEKTVTAASILKGTKSFKTKAWLCAGPKRTGCGGGKKGGHVLATLF